MPGFTPALLIDAADLFFRYATMLTLLILPLRRHVTLPDDTPVGARRRADILPCFTLMSAVCRAPCQARSNMRSERALVARRYSTGLR